MLDLSWPPGLGGGKSGLTTLEDYTTGSIVEAALPGLQESLGNLTRGQEH